MNNEDNASLLRWLAVAVLLIGTFLYIMFANSPEGEEAVVIDPSEVDLTVNEGDNSKGDESAENYLVEYSDFQCPACNTRVPVVEALMAEFGTKVKFAYRHFPLRSIHPNAQLAAQATEAAAMQGEFWAMHDKLFEEQSSWSRLSTTDAASTFATYAEELGLNVEQFSTDLTSSAAKTAVDEDYASGVAAGVNATPTFYFNGEKVTVATGDLEQFRSYIREKLKENSDA